MGTRITLDTHTLLWFFHKESNGKLSSKALTTIKEAEVNGIIYVPTVVLMEVMRIIEKRKYPVSFDEILQYIEESEAYKIVPLTTKIIKIIKNFKSRDLHDRVIIATTLITDSILVSKDKEIRATGLNVIWSRNPNEPIS
jgi:PIN domain nuclease of toxin-antitoxin system